MAQPPARIDPHDVHAAVRAHQQLGPEYDQAVAESLIERIGEQIDARIEARLGSAGGPVAVRAQGAAALAVFSVIGGTVMTGVAAGVMHEASIPVIIVGWGAIGFINLVFNRGGMRGRDR